MGEGKTSNFVWIVHLSTPLMGVGKDSDVFVLVGLINSAYSRQPLHVSKGGAGILCLLGSDKGPSRIFVLC